MSAQLLHSWFPWCRRPFVCSAPMRTISGPSLAAAVTASGGLGFLGAGYEFTAASLASSLSAVRDLLQTPPADALPIGLGVILFKADQRAFLAALQSHRPAAVWLFAPSSREQLRGWIVATKSAVPECKLFVQVGSVAEAEDVLWCASPGPGSPSVDGIVAQGVADAGGHGVLRGASVVALVPEVVTLLRESGVRERVAVLAAGGVVDGAGVAAALCLGADGVVMGTRFVACAESEAPEGFKAAVVRASDGGRNTVRTRVYDALRGTGDWPEQYGGRGVVNRSYVDHEAGVDEESNRAAYRKAEEEGDWERLTTYAGTAVGGVRGVLSAREIVENTQREAAEILRRRAREYAV